MPNLVVESIALARDLPDESSSYAMNVLAALEQGITYVPDLWAYEVANRLVVASRRQRIAPADVHAFVAALSRTVMGKVSTVGVLRLRATGLCHGVKLRGAPLRMTVLWGL